MAVDVCFWEKLFIYKNEREDLATKQCCSAETFTKSVEQLAVYEHIIYNTR
ncbi:hypothetical protein EMIT0180MI3_30804 [Priestia megaterium]